MNENEAKKKEHNAEERSGDLQWFGDFKTKIRETKTWLEIAAFVVVVAYTCVSYQQWQTAKDTLVASERSWVGLASGFFNVGEYHQGVPLLGPITPDAPLNANFGLENFGHTPADIEEIGMRFEVRVDQVPEEFQYKDSERGGLTIFPSQKIQTVSSNTISIPLKDFDLIKDQTKQVKRLVLHGIVRYRDTFGPHQTKFCLIWTGEDRNFNNCLEHNGAN